MDCCRCGSAAESVFPITMKTSQRSSATPEIHHFRPLMTYSLPSRRISVSMLVASEDATPGSVMAKALAREVVMSLGLSSRLASAYAAGERGGIQCLIP